VSDLRRVSGWFHVSFLLVALMLAVMGSMPQAVIAQEGNVLLSAWTTNPAIIDGTMVSYVGEWDDANHYTITFYDDDTPAGTAALWLKNDADNLYMLWQGSYDDLLTVTYLYFDPENDGALGPGTEDLKVALETEAFDDWYWDGEDWYEDASIDGDQHATVQLNTVLREIAIPLDSGDTYDMSVNPRNTIGVMFQTWPPEPMPVWPEGADPYDASTWGDLVLANPATTVLDSAWLERAVTIDGMETEHGEWSDANHYTVTFHGSTGTAEVWVKNDADNLYMLWRGPIDVMSGQDFYFDPENNGVLTPNGEDAKYTSDTVSFSDGYWDGGWCFDVPDGEQTTGLFDSTIFREVRIPLDSGDPHDMSVEPGNTIGVMFARVDGSWPEDAFYQDASTWGDMLIAGPPQDTVDTATGTGTATFQTNLGGIVDLTAIGEDDLPQDAQDSMPNANFPHGFFTFRIVGIPAGSTVTITITLPDPVTADTEYWKWGPEPSDLTDHWYQIPIDAIDGNTITITLTDNGLGDDVLTGTDEMIIDQGGPGKPNPEEKPTPVGGEVYQTDKLMLLTPHIATIVALATTAIIVKKRRH